MHYNEESGLTLLLSFVVRMRIINNNYVTVILYGCFVLLRMVIMYITFNYPFFICYKNGSASCLVYGNILLYEFYSYLTVDTMLSDTHNKIKIKKNSKSLKW